MQETLLKTVERKEGTNMYQVKFFICDPHRDTIEKLEGEINAWLEEQGDSIEVTEVTQSQSGPVSGNPFVITYTYVLTDDSPEA